MLAASWLLVTGRPSSPGSRTSHSCSASAPIAGLGTALAEGGGVSRHPAEAGGIGVALGRGDPRHCAGDPVRAVASVAEVTDIYPGCRIVYANDPGVAQIFVRIRRVDWAVPPPAAKESRDIPHCRPHQRPRGDRRLRRADLHRPHADPSLQGLPALMRQASPILSRFAAPSALPPAAQDLHRSRACEARDWASASIRHRRRLVF